MPLRVPGDYVPWGSTFAEHRREQQRIAAGPDSAKATEALRRAIARRDEWPFPHVYPPLNSIRRTPNGFVVCPAANVQDLILAFTVPQGYWFYLQQLGLFFSGSVFNFGDFLFSVDKNTPLGGGTFQGVPLTDLQNIPYPLGNLEVGPWTLPRAELFAPNDVIRAKVTNVNLGAGPPNYFAAWLGGYLLPTVEAPFAE